MVKIRPLIVLSALAVSLATVPGAAADVRVRVNVGVAPPPIVLAPPPLVVVPGTSVHYVPSASFNLFVHGGRYYSFHNGAWFVATSYGAPWSAVSIEALPAPVRAVPVKHYKVAPGYGTKQGPTERSWCPPGQAKKGRC